MTLLGSEIEHGIFWGFVGSLRDFILVLSFAPIRSSLSLEIRINPPGPFVQHTAMYGTPELSLAFFLKKKTGQAPVLRSGVGGN